MRQAMEKFNLKREDLFVCTKIYPTQYDDPETAIEEALRKGEKVQLIGFGTFEVRQRKARQGRNPRKPGEVIKIAASKAPVFKAGKALKDAVNK